MGADDNERGTACPVEQRSCGILTDKYLFDRKLRVSSGHCEGGLTEDLLMLGLHVDR